MTDSTRRSTQPTLPISDNVLYLSVSTVAEILSISPGTLRRWIAAGRVPIIRVGGDEGPVRVARSWVEEQMEIKVMEKEEREEKLDD